MAKDVLPGGLADNKPDSDFDPKALKDGVKVELEHTDDPQVAKEVSKDHLEEFPEYYSALKVMEQKLKDKTFKKSSLMKGAKQRLFPVKGGRADTQNPEETGFQMSNWQTHNNSIGRTRLAYDPELQPNPQARARAIHSLHGKTSVRRGKNGEREFLLHRGIGNREKTDAIDIPSRKTMHGSPTSWTPNHEIASSFSNHLRDGGLLSAWIPESAIKHIPKQLGHSTKKGKNLYDAEHEVIVDAGNYDLVHDKEVKRLTGQGKRDTSPGVYSLDQAINFRANIDPRARPDVTETYANERTKRSFKKSSLLQKTPKPSKQTPHNWRQPTDQELGNEYDWEYRHVKSRFGDIFPTKEHFVAAAKQSQLAPLPDNTERTTDLDDIEDVRDMTSQYQYPRDVDRIVHGLKSGATLPSPIVIRHGSEHFIMGGNTRQNLARIHGITPHALVVDVPRKKDEFKKSSLIKGAARRLYGKFDPKKELNEDFSMASWVGGNVGQDPAGKARAKIPDPSSNAKLRMTNKLSNRAQVRLNPETKQREFLLHRQMSAFEFNKTAKNGRINHQENEHTSWTPQLSTITESSGIYGRHTLDPDEVGTYNHVVSAWIPETHIKTMPVQYGETGTYNANKRGAPTYTALKEQEVIVRPGHNSQIHEVRQDTGENPKSWTWQSKKLAASEFQKSSLIKGAMRRLAPWNQEARQTTSNIQDDLSFWQEDGQRSNREDLSRINVDPSSKKRTLHKLSGMTPTKVHDDGTRSFLLHRGMSMAEFNKHRTEIDGQPHLHHKNSSSWTPNLTISGGFASDYGRDLPQKEGAHVSAWVHENDIALMPNQHAQNSDSDGYKYEQEIIVRKGGTSPLAHRDEVAKLTGVDKDDKHTHPGGKILDSPDRMINFRQQNSTSFGGNPIERNKYIMPEFKRNRFKKSSLIKSEDIPDEKPQLKGRKVIPFDATEHHGKKVFVFFNLHNNLWSIRHNGKTIGHTDKIVLDQPEFKVSEAGRQRVIRDKKKNVHAGVSGFVNAEPSEHGPQEGRTRASYNPYRGPHFTEAGTENSIHTADKAHMQTVENTTGQGPKRFGHVYATNPKNQIKKSTMLGELAASELKKSSLLQKAPILHEQPSGFETKTIDDNLFNPQYHTMVKQTTLPNGLTHHVYKHKNSEDSVVHSLSHGNPEQPVSLIAGYVEGKGPKSEYTATLTSTEPDHQGKGYGTLLKELAVKHHGKMVSDSVVSSGEDNTWNKLSTVPGVQVKRGRNQYDIASDQDLDFEHLEPEAVEELELDAAAEPHIATYKPKKLAASEFKKTSLLR